MCQRRLMELKKCMKIHIAVLEFGRVGEMTGGAKLTGVLQFFVAKERKNCSNY